MSEGMAAACASCGGIFSIARWVAPLGCGCGSRCGSGETDYRNGSTIACRMAAAQFFSVFLRCEADQRLGRVGEALVRGIMHQNTARILGVLAHHANRLDLSYRLCRHFHYGSFASKSA